MIWLWRICFSAVWLLPSAAATVSGSVELLDSREPAVRRHHDYSGVVVWLQPLDARAKAAVHLDPVRAEMLQKNKRFTPHILAIPRGSSVSFPNLDLIFHNAFSNFSGQIFDIGLYPPGSSRTVTFQREGVVRVFCNIHPTMSAAILVLNTPWYAVSRDSGEFEIRNVPPGEYRLRLFHERAAEERLRALERAIEVAGEPVVLPKLRISETGYLQISHKNKFGKDYPPVPDDHGTYMGATK
jgi:plastocyanin